MYLTALRLIYVPVRSKSGTCPATQRLLPTYAAKRPPGGQRDDGLTCNGRLTARRERIFLTFFFAFRHLKFHFGGPETGSEKKSIKRRHHTSNEQI